MKRSSLLASLSFITTVSATVLKANPADGHVAAGQAAINTIPGTVTVRQASNQAIINWQSFSIGAGEATKFIQPSRASAVLNRVLGGQTSVLNGSLSANGQVFLINGNGIVVGPHGTVNTAGFLASTRDISDPDFLNGNLSFSGSNNNGVENLGSINAIGGDVILIGKTADNQGSITSEGGTVGLAAADSVLITQSGMEHVFVHAVAHPTSASGRTGVNNSGTIKGASVELKAANGNIYALATNNSGIIRATGTARRNGHIWLVAEGNQGATKNTGTLYARGKGGQGGSIETSGESVQAGGTVDAGAGGTWLIDPTDININTAAAGTIDSSLNAGTTVTENSSAGTGGSGDITVSSALSWTGAGILNLDAYRNVSIAAPITGINGTLNIQSGTGITGSSTATAAISVGAFNLQSGNWTQNAVSEPGNILPAFSATNFSISSGASFLRAAGGGGTLANPYVVSDIYGLEGIGSSAAYSAASWEGVNGTISAGNTSTWNSGAGFSPIADFTGEFNGNGLTVNSLTINRPAGDNVGLFGIIAAGSTIANLSLTNASITGLTNVGGLAGTNAGLIQTSNVSGTISGEATGSTAIGGLVGKNSNDISSSFSTATVNGGSSNIGGLTGENDGSVASSYATGNVSSANTGTDIGGLIGYNNGGTVSIGYATGSVSAASDAGVGGLVGENAGTGLVESSNAKGSAVTGQSDVGGLVGVNDADATITAGTAVVNGATQLTVAGNSDVGGLTGNNLGTINQSYVLSTGGEVEGVNAAGAPGNIGGLVGNNGGTIVSSYANIAITEANGASASNIGGLVGANEGSLTSVYSQGSVTGQSYVGGLVGNNSGSLGIQSYASGSVAGSLDVGGLVGENTGDINQASFAEGAVHGNDNVGGLVGLNNTMDELFNDEGLGNVTGTGATPTNLGGLVGYNQAGSVDLANAGGLVSDGGLGGVNLGGLIGRNAGTITNVYATGNVSGSATTSLDVGGLVGYNTGIINGDTGALATNANATNINSYANGNVAGYQNVGGLVGSNGGTIGDPASQTEILGDYTQATGQIKGVIDVGGLVGSNSGTIQQSSALGTVLGAGNASNIGGLVGDNVSGGNINVSYAKVNVEGNGTNLTVAADTDTGIGGLVGENDGGISLTFATGNVVGDTNVGGLIGRNNNGASTVNDSYSTGNVTGLNAVGGLAGYNFGGTLQENYSNSIVQGTTDVGGLAGENAARIYENYATGSVAGTTYVGGLTGYNTPAGTIGSTYSTGAITGTTDAGGLVGYNGNPAGIAASFWDGNSTGLGNVGVGNDPDNTGATEVTSIGATPTAFAASTYSSFGTQSTPAHASSNAIAFTDAQGNIAWFTLNGATRPVLAWQAPSNSDQIINGAYVIYTPQQLQMIDIDLAATYVLGQNIDLSVVQMPGQLWNPNTGFVPLGTSATPFTGSFSGATYGVSNLYIAGTHYLGLFGDNAGSISGLDVSGNIVVNGNGGYVGLVAGENASGGTISNVMGSGAITSSATTTMGLGGLVGDNVGSLTRSVANVTLSGTGMSQAGGSVGYNEGSLTDSYATGSITAPQGNSIGGLAGENDGTLSTSYAIGVIDATTGYQVGGLIGYSTGNVSQSYATGSVTSSDGANIGGLIGGQNGGTVVDTYATGAVTANSGDEIGGLVGNLYINSSLEESYASGQVQGTGATSLGGILGVDEGTTAHLYWDHSNAAQAIGAGSGAVTDLHGDTINGNTALYAGLSTSTGFTIGYDGSALVYGSGDNVWRIQTGSEFPLLTALSTQIGGVDYSNAGHTTVAAHTAVTLNSGSNLLATTTTDANGNYVYLFSADNGVVNYLPPTGQTLRISDATNSGDAVAATLYNNNGVPNLLANIEPADLWAHTVRIVSDELNNDLLANSGSAFVTSTDNIYNTKNTNPPFVDVSVGENFDVASDVSTFTLTGNLTADGNITFDGGGTVSNSFNHTVTIQAASSAGDATPTITLNSGLSSNADNRAIVLETSGNFVNNAGTGAFTVANGTYTVYSQNPQGSNQSITDQDGGLTALHLYGTNYTETPTYLLDPSADYQIFTFTPTLTLTAEAVGSTNGNLTVQYGTATPALTYSASGLLAGDTITEGQTYNQVISNQPGEETGYVEFSPVGTYAVDIIPSSRPTSLIGYNLVFDAGTITVTPNTSPVTIDVSGSQTFGYINGGMPTFSYTDSGSLSGDPNFNPTFTTSVGQFASVNRNGSGTVIPYSNTISLNNSSLNNYSNITVDTVDNGYTVNPAPITISGTGSSIYGNTVAAPTLTSTSTLNGGASIYDNSGTGSTVTLVSQGYSLTSSSITSSTDVGTYTIPVNGSTTTTTGVLGNYAVTLDNGSYNITPRSLTITTTQNTSKVYDGEATPTTFDSTTGDFSVSAVSSGVGLVNGDTLGGAMGRVNNTDANVGDYAYTLGTLAVSKPNDYNVTFSNANNYGLDITQRPITITTTVNTTKVYGSADPGFGGDYALTGGTLASGESLEGTLSRQAGQSVTGGPYAYTQGTVGVENSGGVDTSNYNVTFVSENNLSITPAALAITANADTKVYGGTVPVGGFTAMGLQYSDTVGSVTYSSPGLNANADVQGGTVPGNGDYVLTPSAAAGGTFTASNYNINYVAGTLAVTPAPLSIRANNAATTYNGMAYIGGNGVTYSGFVNGQNSSVLTGAITYGGSSQGAINAGTYAIAPSGQFDVNAEGVSNYNISYVNGVLSISKSPLTVTADNQGKVYGAADPMLTYTVTGTLYGSDTSSVVSGVNLATTTGAAATAGTHAITATGGAASNYVITDVNGTLTVAKAAALTVTANNKTKVYGATDPILNDTVTGIFYYGDTASVVSGVSLATTTGAAATVGSFAITATGGTAANYNIADANGTLTVTPAPLTVTANATSKVYGATDPTLSYSVSGLKYSDAASVVSGETESTVTGASATAGTHVIMLTGGMAANYTITDVNGTLTVAQAPLVVTADNQSKTYGGTDPTLTYTPSGALYYGDTYGVISGVTLGTVTGANATAGTHVISATGGVASNYAITDVNGTLGVAKAAALTVTANNQSKVYGAADPTLTDTLSGTFYYSDTASAVTGVTNSTTTGASATVGDHAITPSGGTAANYNLTYVNGDLNVTPASLLVSATNATITYNGTSFSGGNGVTYTGFAYGQTSSVLGGTLAFAGTSQGASNVGSYTIVPSGYTSDNYTISYANGTLQINPASLNITANNESVQYTDTSFSGGNGVTYSGFVNGQTSAVLGGVITYGGSSQGAINAGSYVIAASGQTSSNYNLIYHNGALTVTKAPLTITANNQTKAYGAADPALTYTVGGTFYGSDSSSLVSGVTLSTVTGASATAGTHAITATGGTAANYVITSDINGTLTVNPAALTVTANDAGTTYSGTAYTGGNGVTYSGFQYADNSSVVTGAVGYTGTSQGAVNAGSYVITPGGLSASNYVLSYVNGTLNIAKAPLTVTANNINTTYSGSPYSGGTVAYTGFVDGQNSTVLGGALAFGGTSQGAVNAGSYSIVPSGQTSNNYQITYANGNLNINSEGLTVTANSATEVYNGTVYAGGNGVTYSGFVDGQNASGLGGTLVYGGTAQGASNVGSYSIAPGGYTSSNYTISYVANTLSITPAPLTITADNASKSYNTVAYTGGNGVTYSGFVDGQTSSSLSGSIAYSGTSQGAVNAGSYTIVATGQSSNNYSVSYVNGNLTINKAPITITANDQSKVYGATDPTLTYTVGGLYASDPSSVVSGVTLSTATGAAATAGTHTISALGGTAENYFVTADTSGVLTVSKASLAVTADNQSKIYGGTDPTLTYTPSGTLYYGDNYGVISGVSLVAATGASATAGSHTITAAGGIAANYNITDVDGILTVGQAGLTVTADNQSKVYGAADPVLTYSVTGNLFYGDTDNVVTGAILTTATGSAATAGTHTITVSGDSASNYILTNVNGTLDVSKAGLTVTADNRSKVYGGADPALTYTPSGPLYYGDSYSVITGLTLSTATAANATAGLHPITVTGGTAANYNITDVNGILDVSPAALTVTSNDQSKIYGGADPTLTYTASGTLYYGDTYGVITGINLSTATGANATAGTHVITASGGTAANYAITDVNGVLDVGKAAALTVTANAQTKAYGGADPILTDTVSGTLYYEDGYGVVTGTTLSTATGADATAGAHIITATDSTAANYNVNDVNGVLTVSKAALDITANNQTVTYGHSNPALTYTVIGLAYGDTISVVGGVTLSTASGADATAGNHVIAVSGGTAANYTPTYIDGNLTVSRAPLNLVADNESKNYGQIYIFNGTEFTIASPLYYGNTISKVTLTSPATGATTSGATNPIEIVPGSAVGTGLNNYLISYVPGVFTTNLAVLGNNSTPQYNGAEFAQLIGEMYDANYLLSYDYAYEGTRKLYHLDIPGATYRVLPKEVAGIGNGSSRVETSFGIERSHLDRFNPFLP